jgi:hypothetical protein
MIIINSDQTLIENANKKLTELLNDTSTPIISHTLEFIRFCVGTEKGVAVEMLSWPIWDNVINKIIKYGEDTEVTELADRWYYFFHLYYSNHF